MFKAAERAGEIPKDVYVREVPKLRAGLLKAQEDLRDAKVALILVVAGSDGAGKGETVNRLHEWFDPRGVETNAFGPLSDEEKDRPDYWRFWRTLPARGRVGIFFGSWYTDPIVSRTYGKSDDAAFRRGVKRIEAFERQLVLDGALIVKVWLHLSKKAQKKRLQRLEKDKKTRWRVSPLDWKHFELYDRFFRFSSLAVRRTHTKTAPWTVVGARDDRYREIAVGRALLAAIRRRLGSPVARLAATRRAQGRIPDALGAVDLSRTISDKDYEKRLARAQGRLSRLSHDAWRKGVSTVLALEGWDAAGKGGSIRRLAEAMDARLYRVVPIAAPNDEERAHHYLWRFWRHIPRDGRVTVYDRSWYGRVLVERVEGFAREDEWKRAYDEIAEFEDQLVAHGTVVLKFWVHISKAEQLRRFEERAQTSFKKYKITDEDWRNRKKWDPYVAAVNEMVARTHRPQAPWIIVSGNDKRWSRIQILEAVCDRLERAL
jgi:polyphosphate:AMP phosphotransferase